MPIGRVILALLPYIILCLSIFGLWHLYTRKKREALKKLSNHLHGHIVRFRLFPTFNCEYQGSKVSIFLIPPGKGSPPYLDISLVKSSLFKLSIYKEGFLSRLGERMGIVHKVATEDASFDKKFLIFSNDPTQAMTYFSSGTVKNVIKELFDSGFNEVLVNGKEILIQKEDYIPEKDLEPEFITGILQNLTLLSRTL